MEGGREGRGRRRTEEQLLQKRTRWVCCVADSSLTVQVACSGSILLFGATLCWWQASSTQATVQL